MRDPEPLGDDHRAEVKLLARDDVGPPPRVEREEVGRSLARDATGEAVADVAHVPLEVWLGRRQPFRREAFVRAGDERGESGRFDPRRHQGSAGEGDGVTGRRSRTGDGDERLQVPAAAGEGQEDVHEGGLCRSPC
jgi:hypothetical protein